MLDQQPPYYYYVHIVQGRSRLSKLVFITCPRPRPAMFFTTGMLPLTISAARRASADQRGSFRRVLPAQNPPLSAFAAAAAARVSPSVCAFASPAPLGGPPPPTSTKPSPLTLAARLAVFSSGARAPRHFPGLADASLAARWMARLRARAEKSQLRWRSSKANTAGTEVSQLRKERLPEVTSATWNKTFQETTNGRANGRTKKKKGNENVFCGCCFFCLPILREF